MRRGRADHRTYEEIKEAGLAARLDFGGPVLSENEVQILVS